MQTKDILIWLGVFIVGSLVVSFLIAPSSFQSFKSNIKSIIPKANIPQKSTSLGNNNDYCEEMNNMNKLYEQMKE